MVLEYDLDGMFTPGSDAVMDLQTARCFVDNSTRLCLIYLTRARDLGYRIPRLRQSGVRYAEDRFWRNLPGVYKARLTDCKNLTPIDIAERIFYDGVQAQPAFRWFQNPGGIIDYHILTQVGSDFVDTSLELGMNRELAAKFYA